jgi:hypothetical protein
MALANSQAVLVVLDARCLQLRYAATIDDGSCCFDICVNINVTAGSFPAENSWTFTDGLGNVLASGAGASSADLCLLLVIATISTCSIHSEILGMAQHTLSL